MSRTHCEIWWRIGDDLGVLQQGRNEAHLSLWRAHKSSHVQGCAGRKLASFCSDNVPQLWGCFFVFVFLAGQCSIPHSQVNQGVDGGPPDQEDPVIASPISRPKPNWKPLECDQEEDGKSRAINQSWAAWISCTRSGIKSPNSNVKDWWRACKDAWNCDWKIRVIPPNIDFQNLPKLKYCIVVLKMNMNLFSLHYLRSKNTASFLLFWPVVIFCK